MAIDSTKKHFLVVGFGSIGRRHVRNLKTLFSNCSVTVLRHGDGCRESKLLYQEGADNCIDSLNDVLQLELTAAIIANPASLHLQTAEILTEKNIPIFIEKPFSHSTEGLSDFINHCAEKKIVLMVGYNLRFTPSLQKFRQLLSEKIIGRILSVRSEVGQYLPSWRPDQKYQDTVSAQKALGGGVLLELSHEIDYLVWLFGYADSVTAVISRQSDLEIDVEDTAHVLLSFSSHNKEKKLPAALTMDFVRHDTTRTCTVVGTEGTLRWDGINRSVDIFDRAAGSWKNIYHDENDSNASYLEELRYFADGLDTEDSTALTTSVLEAKHVVEIVEAAKKSSALKRMVELQVGK